MLACVEPVKHRLAGQRLHRWHAPLQAASADAVPVCAGRMTHEVCVHTSVVIHVLRGLAIGIAVVCLIMMIDGMHV